MNRIGLEQGDNVLKQVWQMLVVGTVCVVLSLVVGSGVVGCGPTQTSQENVGETTTDGSVSTEQMPADEIKSVEEIKGTQVVMNLDMDWKKTANFFDFPQPSDLRLTPSGAPDLTGFPNPEENVQVKSLLETVSKRKGFPLIPVAYFKFTAAPAKGDLSQPVLPTKDASIFVVNVDETSAGWGTMYPVVSTLLEKGTYVPDHLLAVALYPGTLLEGKRRYAFVVMRSFKDTQGQPLGVPLVMEQLKAGVAPSGNKGDTLLALYQPLWKTLAKIGIDSKEVAAATVFTTGDVVAELEQISKTLLTQHQPEITDLKLDPDDGNHPTYCELLGKIKQPQFQKGKAPFNQDGLFEMDAQGVPVKQGDEELPVVITIPKKTMPANGFPLMMYVHGSGGLSSQGVDRGKQKTPGGPRVKGEGPAFVVAEIGVGTVSTAMPVNPERLPGASDIAYINFNNLSAFRDLFRQGVIEARLLLDATLRLRIDPKVLGACQGVSLPTGETSIRFSGERLSLMGQSMGGMYTNMIGAVEHRFKALIPTGAGGYWSFFALNSNVQLLKEPLIRSLLQSTEVLTFTHPALHLLQMAWEPSDPYVYLPRLSRAPLSGHDARHIYQPIGANDSYFPEVLLDVMSLGYGNQQAGSEVWPGTQQRLKVGNLDGIAQYPVKLNRKSNDGKAYTGVTVQYKPDSISNDGHAIAFQLDEVIYQYRCFLETFLKTGTAVVPAPSPLNTPCP